MQKITKDDVQSMTTDIVKTNIEQLKSLFPEVFTEDRIDFEALQSLLGKYADKSDERYSFNWKGKANARRIAQTPSTATLRPSKEESKNWDKTENLYIEGDNLEVLKLLQKSYHNKIKMIYIDPPYNTGKDFVYPDDFKDNLKNYLELTEQIGEDGKKLSTNSDTSGRYHSNWLNMMYPRLKLAKNLLKDDGVIFISIDDNEVHNLRKICDEVFGEENFVANFLWKKKSTTSNVEGTEVSSLLDSTLCYRKTNLQVINQRIKLKETRSYPYSDSEGNYRLAIIEKKDSGAYKRDTMKFEILGRPPRVGKRWQIGIDTAKLLEQKNRFLVDGEIIKLKIYDFEDKDTFSAQPNLLDSFGTTDSAAKVVNELIFGVPELFDNPKPLELIKHLISISTTSESIVLDFFSGSSTTAHAVMQLNFEDQGKRKFIMVQLPEPTDGNSEAFKAGYKNICEIGKERIRRAGDKIVKELKEKQSTQKLLSDELQVNPDDLDIGFKVFKLDTSNIKTWDSSTENIEQTLLDSVSNIKTERTQEDVLYEVLLKYGLDLTLPIEEFEQNGKKLFSVGFGALVICLDNDIDISIAEKIVEIKDSKKPETMNVIFKDNGFRDDVVKTNTIQLLTKHGVESVRSI